MNIENKIYTSGPLDYFEDWIPFSEFTDFIVELVREYPRQGISFEKLWERAFQMLYLLHESNHVDHDYRFNMPFIFFKFYPSEVCMPHSYEMAVCVKCDNNGQVFAIKNGNFELPHDYDDEWSLVETCDDFEGDDD